MFRMRCRALELTSEAYLIVFVFFVCVFFHAADGAISCQIDTPERDLCIREAVQDMLPKLTVNIMNFDDAGYVFWEGFGCVVLNFGGIYFILK